MDCDEVLCYSYDVLAGIKDLPDGGDKVIGKI